MSVLPKCEGPGPRTGLSGPETSAPSMGANLARGAYITVDPPHRVVFSWGIPSSDALPSLRCAA